MAPRNGLAPAPFVLTLEMDGESFARFDALRRQRLGIAGRQTGADMLRNPDFDEFDRAFAHAGLLFGSVYHTGDSQHSG